MKPRLSINRRVADIEKQAKELRRLASDVTIAPTIRELSRLAREDSDTMLLRGSLLIAKLDDPDIDIEAYLSRVDEMGNEISRNCKPDASPESKRKTLHKYLFEENGFRGGRAEYYHPAVVISIESLMNVRDSPLLSPFFTWNWVDASESELKVWARTFVARHIIDDGEGQLIDVFERGKLLTTEDARNIVVNSGKRELTSEDLRAQNPIEILNRVLGNLINVAGNDQDAEAINRYCEAAVAIDPQSVLSRRMRSQIRMMTGRNAAAIQDFDWLIDNDEQGFAQAEATRLREALIKRQQEQEN